MYMISKKGKPPIKSEDISAPLSEFLDRCLTVDVDSRASAQELTNHRFLKKAVAVSCLIPNIKATQQRKKGLL